MASPELKIKVSDEPKTSKKKLKEYDLFNMLSSTIKKLEEESKMKEEVPEGKEEAPYIPEKRKKESEKKKHKKHKKE